MYKRQSFGYNKKRPLPEALGEDTAPLGACGKQRRGAEEIGKEETCHAENHHQAQRGEAVSYTHLFCHGMFHVCSLFLSFSHLKGQICGLGAQGDVLVDKVLAQGDVCLLYT